MNEKDAPTQEDAAEKERFQNWLRVLQAMQQEQEDEEREFIKKRWLEAKKRKESKGGA